jgi:hypothetical protein
MEELKLKHKQEERAKAAMLSNASAVASEDASPFDMSSPFS